MSKALEGSIGVVVVTHRARDLLERCLPPLLEAPERPRVVVMNSSSDDGTVERAAALGAETFVLPRAAFDHGAAREQVRRWLDCAVVVMTTPDATALDATMVGKLARPVLEGRVALAYGRQAPGPRSPLHERVARALNYPPESSERGLEDAARLGSFVHFCSNAWAAWSNAALDEIGGFAPTLVSEDAIAAAKLLRRGHRIAYVAEAVVDHGHDLGPAGLFRRQFDVGWTRAREDLGAWGADERRGALFARALMRAARRRGPGALARASLSLAASYLGYRSGKLAAKTPDALGRAIGAIASSQDYYWRSDRDLFGGAPLAEPR